MVDAARARRLAGRIKQIVAVGIETQIKDPRLGMVTITDVRVSGDLHEATVFYTVFGGDDEHTESAAALESAKGVLRSEVGRQTGVRFTPSLTFSPDVVPEAAKHINDLLAVAAAADARVQAASVGASPAGDADPYRHPRVDDDPESDDPDSDDPDSDDPDSDDPENDDSESDDRESDDGADDVVRPADGR